MAGMIWFKILETQPPDLAIRKWREIRKSVMKVMGLHWHRHMLPQHFAPNAAFVYKYQWRTAAYRERKRKAAQKGRSGTRMVDPRAATDQLTFSGALRDNVTRNAFIQVFPTRFKLVMPGTSYTPVNPRHPNRPHLQKEITTLLEREKKELAAIGKKHALELLKEYREPRTTIIKG